MLGHGSVAIEVRSAGGFAILSAYILVWNSIMASCFLMFGCFQRYLQGNLVSRWLDAAYFWGGLSWTGAIATPTSSSFWPKPSWQTLHASVSRASSRSSSGKGHISWPLETTEQLCWRYPYTQNPHSGAGSNFHLNPNTSTNSGLHIGCLGSGVQVWGNNAVAFGSGRSDLWLFDGDSGRFYRRWTGWIGRGPWTSRMSCLGDRHHRIFAVISTTNRYDSLASSSSRNPEFTAFWLWAHSSWNVLSSQNSVEVGPAFEHGQRGMRIALPVSWWSLMAQLNYLQQAVP